MDQQQRATGTVTVQKRANSASVSFPFPLPTTRLRRAGQRTDPLAVEVPVAVVDLLVRVQSELDVAAAVRRVEHIELILHPFGCDGTDCRSAFSSGNRDELDWNLKMEGCGVWRVLVVG
jgi:hypothetical protein